MTINDNNQGSLEFGKAVKIPINVKNSNSADRNDDWSRSLHYRKPYEPGTKTPYSLSRSKVEMFLKCPRCFYLEQRLGVKIPSMPSFTLNSAVDCLLKKEFDIRRSKGDIHPLMVHYGIDAVPAAHENLDLWRNNFKGIRAIYKPANFELFGAIDDLWINSDGEYHIVDYKATSTKQEISLEDQWKQWYKIQVEFYQWLFRQNGFKVSDIAYFVFANATKDRCAFDGKLEFELSIMAHNGSDKWVEPTLDKIKNCLESDKPPAPSADCEYCAYTKKVQEVSLL